MNQPIPTNKCGVRNKQSGVICHKPTNEVWDYQDILDDVNRVWKQSDIELEMTTLAICTDHMAMCPEI